MTNPTLRSMLALLLLAPTSACSGGFPFFGSRDAEFTAPSTAPLVGRLTQAASCDDLLDRLRRDEIAKVELAAWRLSQVDLSVYSGGGVPVGSWTDASVAEPAPGGAPALADSASPTHTETNTQIAGVDEGDFVETDGKSIYLLHGTDFYVLDADPIPTIANAAHVAIEGYPNAMFVAGGRAAVFSSVQPWSCGVVGTQVGFATGDVATPSVACADVDPAYGGLYAPYSLTKITVLDVTATVPTVVSERYVEGYYVDSRRIDDVVRVVIHAYTPFAWYATHPEPSPWTLEAGTVSSRELWLERVAAWRDAARAAIGQATLADFLPSHALATNRTLAPVPAECTSYYVAETVEAASSFAMVASFTLSDPNVARTTTIRGGTEIVYENDASLVLTQSDYRWNAFNGIATQETAIHVFSTSGLELAFLGSGKVEGNVRNAYSIDEDAGVLRVVSTALRPTTTVTEPTIDWIPTTTVSHVKTFAIAGGTVSPLGTSPDLGLGESVQAVRFVGDEAYVVTFRQVDPLFVVSLADPVHPTLLGELTIPGFSSYIHPLDANHLLTIGTSAAWGLAIQIFDITDRTAPALLHVHEIPQASSAAQWDPHAFTFDPVRSILAIPVDSYGTTFESTLRLFDVSVAGGIVERGVVSHGAYYTDCLDSFGYYVCGYGAAIRRGLFIGDYVYAIGTRAATVSAIAAPADVLERAELPAPDYGTAWLFPID